MLLNQRLYIHIKGRFACHWFIYGVCFQYVFCSEDPSTPRLTRRQDERLLYSSSYSHTVLFHQEGSNSVFVGGNNVLLHVDVNSVEILESFTLDPNVPKLCHEKSCENDVTVIEQFQNCTFVCGTNGGEPKCWKLYPGENNLPIETVDGIGISPHAGTQNSLSLAADGDLYAAAPLYRDGTLLQFRRKAGKRNRLWMHDQWVSDPTFISSFLVKRKDPLNDNIYVLFREKNSDSSPEADPWISRVARVCKVDEGGPKQCLQNIWTSFLKARLVCGIPGESLYFNRLQDVFVLHDEDLTKSRIYTLFSSNWNSTAVCIYNLTALDGVFENSFYKGYDKEIPSPRPGTCVKNSNSIPIPTLHFIQDYPEMKDWIQPIHKDKPFFTSNNNYTKIAIDRVEGSNGNKHNVLLLASDNGTILKILEDGSKAFIISETHLCNCSGPIQSMKLDSKKRKLFVGYPGQMSVLDLQRCQDYGTSCPDCVLSRDPYCAWTEHGCTLQTKGGIQNIADGNTRVCDVKPEGRIKRDLGPLLTVALRIRHTVPTEVPFYLSCPVDSHHATYIWKHENKNSTCKQTQSECLLLIPAMKESDYGSYTCISHERDYVKTVRTYELHKPAFNHAFKQRAQEWLMATFVTVVLYLCWP